MVITTLHFYVPTAGKKKGLRGLWIGGGEGGPITGFARTDDDLCVNQEHMPHHVPHHRER
jgi:hypothetical protein